ncbi:MAG: hypothetical protein WAX89_03055 [Alphaproteobacteria bacterium]
MVAMLAEYGMMSPMEFIFKVIMVIIVGVFVVDYLPRLYEDTTGTQLPNVLAGSRDGLAQRCAAAQTTAAQELWCGLLDRAGSDDVEPAAGPAELSPRQKYSLTRHKYTE